MWEQRAIEEADARLEGIAWAELPAPRLIHSGLQQMRTPDSGGRPSCRGHTRPAHGLCPALQTPKRC